jgi:putative membrane protein
MDDYNFMELTEKLFRDPDKYMGLHIRVRGFVFRINDFTKDQFIIARMAIYCCSTDASIYGTLCELDESVSVNLKNEQWYEITGTIYPKITIDDVKGLYKKDVSSQLVDKKKIKERKQEK